MKEEEIVFLIKDIVSSKFNKEIPDDFLEKNLASLELDSLELLTLVVELETTLQIKLEDEIFYKSPTVKDMVAAMSRQTKSSRNSGS